MSLGLIVFLMVVVTFFAWAGWKMRGRDGTSTMRPEDSAGGRIQDRYGGGTGGGGGGG